MQCPCTISASHNLCISYYLNLHCASYIDHGRSEDDSPKTVSYQLNTILFTEWKFLLKINKLRLGFLEMQVKTSNMKKNQLFFVLMTSLSSLGVCLTFQSWNFEMFSE